MTRWILVVCVAIVLGTAARAEAQPVDQRAEAQRLYNAAMDASDADDHALAVRLLEEAYAVLPLHDFVFNIATQHRLAGDRDAARAAYRRYLALAPDGRAAELARVRLEELDAEAPAPAEAAAPDAPPAAAPEAPPAPTPVALTFDHRAADARRLASQARRLKLGGLVAAGAGAISLGLAFHYGNVATGHEHQAARHAGDPGVQQRFLDDAAAADTRMIAGTVAGLALVGGGAALYYAGWQRGRTAERTVVAPVPVTGGAGVAVAGRF